MDLLNVPITPVEEELFSMRPALRPCVALHYEKNRAIEVRGGFHGFFPNYQEFENGAGNYTEALVEKDDGTVVACVADSVRFLDRGEV